MIDLVVYASGYVLVSKLIECRRDKFIKDRLYSEDDHQKPAILKLVASKNHHTLKQTNIIE